MPSQPLLTGRLLPTATSLVALKATKGITKELVSIDCSKGVEDGNRSSNSRCEIIRVSFWEALPKTSFPASPRKADGTTEQISVVQSQECLNRE